MDRMDGSDLSTRGAAPLSRSEVLRLGLALPASLLLAACGGWAAAGRPFGARPQADETAGASAPAPIQEGAAPADQAAAAPEPTPACADADDVTPPQTEGPYFKPSSPQRTSLLEPGMAGTRLVLTGRVLATDATACRPVARALLDFWQADDRGTYDAAGYRLRGHQFTDESGAYRLETIVPGLYTGRTRHIHVKVQAPNRPILTTQLYFPGEPRNARDPIYDPRLVLPVQDTSEGKLAAFDFVLRVA